MPVKRDQIIQQLITNLKGITVANGYYTDLSSRVYDNRETQFRKDELPAINVRDTEDAEVGVLESGVQQSHDHKLQVEIEIITAGTVSPVSFRKLLADVNKAIGADLTLGGYANDVDPVTTITHYPEQNEKRILGGTRIININYRTKAWQEE